MRSRCRNPTFPAGSIKGDTLFQINITGDQIIYQPLTNVTYGTGAFNGFVFKFSGAPTISSVTLDGSSTFTPTATSFTGDSVSLNLSGNTVTTTSEAILDVTFAKGAPEPATLGLLGLGLAGLGLSRRRHVS